MRELVPPELERARVTHPRSEPGQFEGFYVITGPARKLNVMCGVTPAWEHVSVSVTRRKNDIPTWAEMCFIKNLFWNETETVIQYHPPKSVYINIHPGVLHLWRPVLTSIPLPPLEYV